MTILLVASVLVWCLSADAQSVTGKKFTVTFRFKQGNVPEPEVRVYILIDAKNDGDAAIEAYKRLAEKLTVAAQEKLEFLEAQQKQ